MENKIIVANLKNYMSYSDTMSYLDCVEELKDEVIFVPTNIYIPYFLDRNHTVGIQDISHLEGITTGEVSADQAASLGIKYTIIGHNERVINLNETDNILNKKINNSLKNKLKIVFCVGEKEKSKFDITCNVIKEKLENTLFNLNKEEIKNIIIAYEPFWAIGSDKVPTNDFTQKIVKFIKDLIFDRFNFKISVLYGGSVKESNIDDLKNISNIDGFLIGEASIDSSKLVKIVRSTK